ncbi:hypothetical protein D3C71_188810 [compost metagenome]
MPNHVINEILLHGVKLEDCRQHLLNGEGRVSFAVLLPLPLNFWAGSVGVQHEKAFPGTHLDAATEMWGTKWNAYGDPTAEDTDAGTLIRFQSAWSHPRGWTCALFNTLKCEISVSWLSEGSSDGVSEKYVWDAKGSFGPSWEHEKIADGSDEHRRLHKLLWGVEEFTDEDDEDDSDDE